MDIKYKALSKGLFKHTTNPGLVKEVKLESYLSKCTNTNRLIKEIAYCLITTIEERLCKEEYRVAYFSCSTKDWKLKVVYSEVKHFKSLNDLIIVDISILETDRETIFTKYKWFKKDLIKELNNYGE